MNRSLAVLLLCTVLLAGCRRPVSYETFVLAGEAEEDIYQFELDLSDEGCSYDISFFTKTDAPVFRKQETVSVPIVVNWSMEDNPGFSETVWYPLGENKVPYRTGVVMEQPGTWTLKAHVMYAPAGFRGLGIICKRNENGTRQTP